MRRIGLLHHPKLADSLQLLDDLKREIEGRGLRAWVGSSWDHQALDRERERLDLLITFGGDGTIMRAARAAASRGVPILGINMGRLGFLAELVPGQALEKLRSVLEGRYWLEERAMLRAELLRDGRPVGVHEALNDVVLARGAVARAIRLAVSVDGAPVTTYLADGLILSTATGSTAYSLAAGGPILPPESRCMVATPIVPCLTLLGSLVLGRSSTVEVEVSTHHQAALVMDGQVHVPLMDGDVVRAGISDNLCRFVRCQPRDYFYRTLERRLKGEKGVV